MSVVLSDSSPLQAKEFAVTPSQPTAEVVPVKSRNERQHRAIHWPTVEFSFCSRTVSASKSWFDEPPEEAGLLNAGAYRAE